MSSVEISWVSLWRVLFFAVFVAILFVGKQVLAGLFLAIVISSGLEVVVNFFEKRGIPRALGAVLIFLAAILIFIIVVYALVPRVIVELNAIVGGFREAGIVGIAPFFDKGSFGGLNGLVAKLSADFFSGDISPFGVLSKALGGIGLALAIIIASFYLTISRDGVERFLRVVLPDVYEKQGLRIYERSRKRIGMWFQMQIVLSVAVGILVWTVLSILGVRHAFLLGVVAGLFELVPFVGPILSGASAVLVAFASSPMLALYALIAFLGIQQLESHVLVPLLTKKMVGIHPVLVIAALFIGFEALGFLGILIAVPATAVFEEVIDEWSSAKKNTFPRHSLSA